MSKEQFVTVINCMDGRTQLPVIEWLKSRTGASYVDNVTEPGPGAILAADVDKWLVESIKRRVGISVQKHRSNLVAIVGHYDCAGNPVNEETQRKQILKAIQKIASWGFGVEVIGLWVDENWQVKGVS